MRFPVSRMSKFSQTMVQNGNLQSFPMFSLQYYYTAILLSLQTYLTAIFQLLGKGEKKEKNTFMWCIPLIIPKTIVKMETNFTGDFFVKVVVLVLNSFFPPALYMFILIWNFMSYKKNFYSLPYFYIWKW